MACLKGANVAAQHGDDQTPTSKGVVLFFYLTWIILFRCVVQDQLSTKKPAGGTSVPDKSVFWWRSKI